MPESAPFTPEQRHWLNGFFAGLLADGEARGAVAEQNAARLMPGVEIGPAGDGDDGAAPWHDPTMPIVERMKLAEGRPLRRKLMAAMGQQDCGQCGYNCEDYAEAIFRQVGRADEPLRAWRQGNRPDAEGALQD